jgi:hypothetical protein
MRTVSPTQQGADEQAGGAGDIDQCESVCAPFLRRCMITDESIGHRRDRGRKPAAEEPAEIEQR